MTILLTPSLGRFTSTCSSTRPKPNSWSLPSKLPLLRRRAVPSVNCPATQPLLQPEYSGILWQCLPHSYRQSPSADNPPKSLKWVQPSLPRLLLLSLLCPPPWQVSWQRCAPPHQPVPLLQSKPSLYDEILVVSFPYKDKDQNLKLILYLSPAHPTSPLSCHPAPTRTLQLPRPPDVHSVPARGCPPRRFLCGSLFRHPLSTSLINLWFFRTIWILLPRGCPLWDPRLYSTPLAYAPLVLCSSMLK